MVRGRDGDRRGSFVKALFVVLIVISVFAFVGSQLGLLGNIGLGPSTLSGKEEGVEEDGVSGEGPIISGLSGLSCYWLNNIDLEGISYEADSVILQGDSACESTVYSFPSAFVRAKEKAEKNCESDNPAPPFTCNTPCIGKDVAMGCIPAKQIYYDSGRLYTPGVGGQSGSTYCYQVVGMKAEGTRYYGCGL
jgi:hypothetical protein